MLVAAQLPPNYPVKPSAMDYVAKYEAAYDKGSVSDTVVPMGSRVPGR